MKIKDLMASLGYSDVGVNELSQFTKTYKSQLINDERFSIRGWNKKTHLVTLELCEEDYANFDVSDFREEVTRKGQFCKFIDETLGQDNKRNVLFEIGVLELKIDNGMEA